MPPSCAKDVFLLPTNLDYSVGPASRKMLTPLQAWLKIGLHATELVKKAVVFPSSVAHQPGTPARFPPLTNHVPALELFSVSGLYANRVVGCGS